MGETTVSALDTISGLVEFLGGGMEEIVATITSPGNSIMLIPVGIFVVGAAIGLGKRLIGR